MKKFLLTIIIVLNISTVPVYSAEYDYLKTKIIKYLNKDTKNIGISFLDVTSGNSFNINGDRKFRAASTLKVPLNMIVYDSISDKKLRLTTKVSYTKDLYEGGTGILQFKKLKAPIPIRRLCEHSIVHSDNIAKNMLMRRMGRENYKASMESILGRKIAPSNNVLSANEATDFLNKLYWENEERLKYNLLVEDMKRTVFHDRLDKYLPSKMVAHKIGNYGSNVSDIGIIYSSRPYILSIYTNGLINAEEKIAIISKMIYDINKESEKVYLKVF